MLDTHVTIRALGDATRLSKMAHEAIVTPDNDVFVSVVTIWEVAIKVGLKKLAFPVDRFEEMLASTGFEMLPIKPYHAIEAGALPRHHADPFDRMLIAQSRTENLVLVTVDLAFARYDVRVLT